ncbi:MAG: fused MFS/spermidine synthase [Verrucomicrobiota bacterium]|jgi:SAM-dependent methyltransferase
MVWLFVAALFTSATLLFWVQPMVAKMLLPLLGGTPAVWNTCMVFFQTMLLAGYAYAHWLTTRFPVRIQTIIHFCLLLVALAVLPIGLSSRAVQSAPWQSDPTLWLLWALVVVVALPFFILSASAPLLQSWFSRLRHRSSADPYFLYAASNLGSLMGLIGYLVLIEPGYPLRMQSRIWDAGYGLLLVLFAGSALMLWRRQNVSAGEPASPPEVPGKAGPATETGEVNWPRRLRWIFWAFIPSSLMLGVTTYLSTDIASVPLLWVVPLGIYLLTFILVFSRRQIFPLQWLTRVLPPMAVFLVLVMLDNADNLSWLQMTFHLGFFFLAALVWHTRLANDRPSSRRLTGFYFCLAVGGVLGGVFNALLAPIIFRTVLEYRLMIVVACILWPAKGEAFFAGRGFGRDLIWPLGIGLLTAGLAVMVPRFGVGLQMSMMIMFGVPVILCYVVSKRRQPFHFALALAAVLIASGFYAPLHGRTLHVERNFFGTLRVAIDSTGRFCRLYHGTTVHGMEFVAPGHQGEPLAYYHRAGPCGQAMKAFNSRPDGASIAIIGLGAGSMAAYAQPGQHWTFYEINPAVIRLAQDTNYFTFLHRCTNASVDFKLGDARLRLREAAANQFDLLVCDAFGSDAPPLHLLNREAMDLYLSKLSPNGLLLFHISSRFLNLRPVIGNLAAHFQLQAIVNADDEPATPGGKLPSCWVALARRPEDLGLLRDDPRWLPLPPEPGMRLWTDDYSNILSIFDWQ